MTKQIDRRGWLGLVTFVAICGIVALSAVVVGLVWLLG